MRQTLRSARARASTSRSIFATADTSASAASAFCALCRPTRRRSATGSSSAPPRASQAPPAVAAAIDEAPRLFGFRNAGAERLHEPPGQPHRERARVVAVQHLDAAAREDPRLRRRIGVDAGVTVEMVLGDVEHGRRDRRERGRRLELEARQLEHEHIGPACRPRGIASSTASPMLPATTRREAGRARERAGERGHRRLAVRSGDREHFLRRRQRAREELDVADELDAARNGSRDGRLVLRDAGADRDQVGAGERRLGERARSSAAHPGSAAASRSANGGAGRVSATRTVAPRAAR